MLNIEYPLLYEYLVWNYNEPNIEGVKKAIEWIKTSFCPYQNIMNICTNFIPSKRVDDSDPP